MPIKLGARCPPFAERVRLSASSQTAGELKTELDYYYHYYYCHWKMIGFCGIYTKVSPGLLMQTLIGHLSIITSSYCSNNSEKWPFLSATRASRYFIAFAKVS